MSDTQQTQEQENEPLDAEQIIKDAEGMIPASDPDDDQNTDANADPEPEPLDFTDQFNYSLPEKQPESEPVSSEQKEAKTEAEKVGVDPTFRGGIPQPNVQSPVQQTPYQQYPQQPIQQQQVFAPVSQEWRDENPEAAKVMDAQQQQVVNLMQYFGQQLQQVQGQLGNQSDVVRSVFEEREQARIEQEKKAQEEALYQRRVELRDNSMKEFQQSFNSTANELVKAGYTKDDINSVLSDAAEIYSTYTPASPPIPSYKGYDQSKVAVDQYLGDAMTNAVELARYRKGMYKDEEALELLPKLVAQLKKKQQVISSSARQAPTLPGGVARISNDADDIYSTIDNE